jgi:hypothetical protein
MPRARNQRLARLAQHSTAAETAEAWHETTLQARVKIAAALRQALAQLAIDPAKVAMLRVADEAALELATAGQSTAGTAPLAGRQDDAGGETFDARISELVRRYRDRQDIDFARVSLAEALAWCLARLE